MGNDPPQISIWHGRRSYAAISQITLEGGAIIDIRIVVVFGSIALVSLHAHGSL